MLITKPWNRQEVGLILALHCTAESDDQLSVTSPEKPEPQYTELQIRQVNPDRGEAPRDFYFQCPHENVVALTPL